jgi:hypothetical protein
VPIVSEERAAELREKLKRKLAQPMAFWSGEKVGMGETELKARLGWKEATK